MYVQEFGDSEGDSDDDEEQPGSKRARKSGGGKFSEPLGSADTQLRLCDCRVRLLKITALQILNAPQA